MQKPTKITKWGQETAVLRFLCDLLFKTRCHLTAKNAKSAEIRKQGTPGRNRLRFCSAVVVSWPYFHWSCQNSLRSLRSLRPIGFLLRVLCDLLFQIRWLMTPVRHIIPRSLKSRPHYGSAAKNPETGKPKNAPPGQDLPPSLRLRRDKYDPCMAIRPQSTRPVRSNLLKSCDANSSVLMIRKIS